MLSTLKLAFGDESEVCASVFRLFKEFRRRRILLQDEERTVGSSPG